MNSQNGIKALGEQWRSSETRNTFAHVKKSYANNADLSGSVSVPSNGWRERERNKTASKPSEPGIYVEEMNTALNDEDVSRIVNEFRKRYPNIKVETQDDNRTISVR